MWELEPDSYIRKEYSELLEFYNLLVEKGWNVSDLPSAEELSENWRALSGWTRNFGKDIGSKGDVSANLIFFFVLHFISQYLSCRSIGKKYAASSKATPRLKT